MTLGDLLKRLGSLLIAAALIAVVIPLVADAPGLNARPDLPRNLGILGAVLIALVYGFQFLGVAGARCQRCGRTAVRNSVFCATHRGELTRMSHEATLHHRRDGRNW